MTASTCYFMRPAFSQKSVFEFWVVISSWAREATVPYSQGVIRGHDIVALSDKGKQPSLWCTLALSCGRLGILNFDILYLPLANLSGWNSISSWGAPALLLSDLGDQTEFLKEKIESCPLQRTKLSMESVLRKTFSWKKNLRFLLIPWSIFFTLKFKIFEKGPFYICTCTFIYTYVYITMHIY